MDARIAPTKFYGSSSLTATTNPTTWAINGTFTVSLASFLSRIKTEFVKVKLSRFDIVIKDTAGATATKAMTRLYTLRFKNPAINSPEVSLHEGFNTVPAIVATGVKYSTVIYIANGDEPEFIFSRDTLLGSASGNVEVLLTSIAVADDPTLVALSAMSIYAGDLVLEVSPLE